MDMILLSLWYGGWEEYGWRHNSCVSNKQDGLGGMKKRAHTEAPNTNVWRSNSDSAQPSLSLFRTKRNS